ncbi:MAG: TatD family hydrolase [Patescibacteria group bacterium]|nr:TatD family hydrolase [Patescibacteria group bacterium]MDE2172524.1 TatD family hydrolase [Patescibacteria group bacterium]
MSTTAEFEYIDIHGHVNFAAYEADREEVIRRARESGVAMISVGTQFETSKKAVELAETHGDMYAAIGLHPIHTTISRHDEKELGEGGKEFTSRGETADVNAYRSLALRSKVVAIGECGLDYYRLDGETVGKQRVEFEKMIDLANEVNKPLMLHIRNGSGLSAYADAHAILKSRAQVKGNLHFYAGSLEEAKPFLDLGYAFSFTGVITFARNYDEIVKYLPLGRIMSETDCPYVTPAPHRGKRNEPLFVREVVRAIAHIRGEPVEKVSTTIIKTAKKFFNINSEEMSDSRR